jgi:hypothetical protein
MANAALVVGTPPESFPSLLVAAYLLGARVQERCRTHADGVEIFHPAVLTGPKCGTR